MLTLYWPNSKSQALLLEDARQGGLRMSLPERHKQLDVLSEPHTGIRSAVRTSGREGSGLFPTQLIQEKLARWHQGQLIYEGSGRGAVFTVTLPPFAG